MEQAFRLLPFKPYAFEGFFTFYGSHAWKRFMPFDAGTPRSWMTTVGLGDDDVGGSYSTMMIYPLWFDLLFH